MNRLVITSLFWLSVFLPASIVCAQTPQGKPVRQQTGTTPTADSLPQQGKHECVEGTCFETERVWYPNAFDLNEPETFYIKIHNTCKAGYTIEFTIESDNPVGVIKDTLKSGEQREIKHRFQGNIIITPNQFSRQVVRKRKEEPKRELPPKDKTSGDWIKVRDDCKNGCRFAKDGLIKVCGNCGADLVKVSEQLIRPENKYWYYNYKCKVCPHTCVYKVKTGV